MASNMPELPTLLLISFGDLMTYSYDEHEGTQTGLLPWTILQKCGDGGLLQLYNSLESAGNGKHNQP
jgi:hypothetical protein